MIIGHQGNGKTTLAEAMLWHAGVVGRPGRVENGNTVLGSQPEERERTQSLALGVASFTWGAHGINLIDTPGYADFVGDALAAMQVADLAVLVVDGLSGLQVSDEALWAHAAALGLPRMVFVNKLDKENSSFEATLAGIHERFGAGVEAVELPVGEGALLRGVADLLTEHVFLYSTGTAAESTELPAEIAEHEHAEHEHLVEDVVQLEDNLLGKYLDGEDVSLAELEGALRDGFVAGNVFPVSCGSATGGSGPVGVDRLLDLICHLGPAPADRPARQALRGGKPTEVTCDPEGEPVAYVFKTQADEYVGQVALLKLLSGTVRLDDYLVNTRTGVRERLHNLLRVVGGKSTGIDTIGAGDIVGAIKLTDVRSGDTLAAAGSSLVVPPPVPPQPVYGIAVAAHSSRDEDKLASALAELVRDDPTLAVYRDDQTHQRVLSGVGEVQVQVALAVLRRRYGVTIDTEPVKVAYRETLAHPVETEGRHKKQSGGHGQFGVAKVRFEPLPRGSGFEFVDGTRAGVIPKSLVPAVGKGIAESMANGGTHGFPIVDVRATVIDGKHHAVDSDEFSFKMAGALALREALGKVGTLVLEPVVHIEVTVPDTLQGDVLSDLVRRRGRIERTDTAGAGESVVVAAVPQGEVTDYAIALRSMTHGRSRFTMRFDRYQERP